MINEESIYDLGTKIHLVRDLNTPINILEELSNDDDWRVKYYIAQNPNTPEKILNKLSKDNSTFVRDVALFKLKHLIK